MSKQNTKYTPRFIFDALLLGLLIIVGLVLIIRFLTNLSLVSPIQPGELPGTLIINARDSCFLCRRDMHLLAVENESLVQTKLTTLSDPQNEFALSPDGRYIAWQGGGAVGVIDLADGREWQVVASGAEDIAWSPDGAHLAYLAGDWLSVVDADGRSPRQLVFTEQWRDLSWSPDGAQLVSYDNSGIFTVNINDGQVQYLIDGGDDPLWSPRGDKIAFSNDGVRLYDTATGTQQLLVEKGGAALWSPDGSRLAVRTGGDVLEIIELDDGSRQRLPQPQVGFDLLVHGWSWSPDGRYVALNGRLCEQTPVDPECQESFIYLIDTQQENLTTQTFGPVENLAEESLAWSPDGSYLAFFNDVGGRNLWVLDATGRQELRPLPLPGVDIAYLSEVIWAP